MQSPPTGSAAGTPVSETVGAGVAEADGASMVGILVAVGDLGVLVGTGVGLVGAEVLGGGVVGAGVGSEVVGEGVGEGVVGAAVVGAGDGDGVEGSATRNTAIQPSDYWTL